MQILRLLNTEGAKEGLFGSICFFYTAELILMEQNQDLATMVLGSTSACEGWAE